MILYHFQVKERDEPRPRAGVLRTREFIMKDSYSFDRDADGLDESYELHVEAYDRIFERSGLRCYRVQADVGMMGGLGAHEYMAPCAAGENEVALAPGYAANVEVASAEPQPVDAARRRSAPRAGPTPGLTTVAEVAGALGVPRAPAQGLPGRARGRRASELVMVWSGATTASTRSSSPRCSARTCVRPATRRSARDRAAGLHRSGRAGRAGEVLLDEGVARAPT